jgi:hypothetical protein
MKIVSSSAQMAKFVLGDGCDEIVSIDSIGLSFCTEATISSISAC